MWGTILPAIIGFVGVLIGVAVTTASNYLLAVRKERAEAAERKLTRAKELKKACRLIFEEFTVGAAAARWLAEQKRRVSEDTKLSLDAWQSYKRVLAPEVSLMDWNRLTMAVQAIHDLRGFISRSPRTSDAATDAEAENGRLVLRNITYGLEALGPYLVD